jgi:hypothetical protein
MHTHAHQHTHKHTGILTTAHHYCKDKGEPKDRKTNKIVAPIPPMTLEYPPEDENLTPPLHTSRESIPSPNLAGHPESPDAAASKLPAAAASAPSAAAGGPLQQQQQQPAPPGLQKSASAPSAMHPSSLSRSESATSGPHSQQQALSQPLQQQPLQPAREEIVSTHAFDDVDAAPPVLEARGRGDDVGSDPGWDDPVPSEHRHHNGQHHNGHLGGRAGEPAEKRARNGP